MLRIAIGIGIVQLVKNVIAPEGVLRGSVISPNVAAFSKLLFFAQLLRKTLSCNP